MQAMILAAGLGQRMRPLTDTIPKPLLKIQKLALIEYHLHALKKSGISDIVINLHHLGEKISQVLKNGEGYGVTIEYIHEPVLLNTGGGIFNALPLFEGKPFLVISADIFTTFDFQTLPKEPMGLAHLILVDNPSYHTQGDFVLNKNLLSLPNTPTQTSCRTLTYGNIGVLHPDLFETLNPRQNSPIFPLKDVLKPAIIKQQVTGEYFTGKWHNIGTAQQLTEVNQQYADLG